MTGFLTTIIVIVVIIILCSIRQINEYNIYVNVIYITFEKNDFFFKKGLSIPGLVRYILQ